MIKHCDSLQVKENCHNHGVQRNKAEQGDKSIALMEIEAM